MARTAAKADAFLTQTNLRAIAGNLRRTYSLVDTHGFDDLLKAIDQQERSSAGRSPGPRPVLS